MQLATDKVSIAIRNEYTSSRNFFESFEEQYYATADRYAKSELPNEIDKDVPETFAKIKTSDVGDAIEHTLADIMPAFSTESPVVFQPEGAQDEQQAYTETEIANNIFIQQSDGYLTLSTACKDALTKRRGIIEVCVRERRKVEYLTLEDADLDQLALAIQEPNTEVIDISGSMTEEEDSGNVLDAELSVTIRKTTTNNELSIMPVPPEELLVNQDHESLNLDGARFVAREQVMLATDLIELGYTQEVVDKLPTYKYTGYTRRGVRNDEFDTLRVNRPHESVRPILVADIYTRIDEDDDGIAELRHIFAAGDFPNGFTILSDEPCGQQPFALGAPFIDCHRSYGISLYDKLNQIQDIKTKVIRQLLTAGERSVRGRMGIVGTGANPNDVKETVFGGIIRLNSVNGIVPIPGDRYPAEVSQLIEIANKWRNESGGSAIDKANEEIAVGGDTAHGLERMMSAMEQLNSFVAKLLAETLLRQTYQKIHYNLRMYWSGDIATKVDGNWVTSTPKTWPTYRKVTSSIGLTMGDRLRLAANYDRLIANQIELTKEGSILVNEQSMYRLLVNRAKSLGIPNPYSYYVNPQSPEGQQAAQARQQRQQQQQQRDQQRDMMNMELLPRVEQIRAQSKAQVQGMQNELATLQALIEKQDNEGNLDAKYDELRLKLIELNAKYDQDPVPDAKPRLATV